MPSLKEINNRIASVRSTLKITSAMKMVASAKLHKAQQAIGNMLPYERLLLRVLEDLSAHEAALAAGKAERRPAHLLSVQRPVHRAAVVAFSSNSSLCGAFNASIIRETLAVIREYRDAGLAEEDIDVFPVGRKMADALRKNGHPCAEDYSAMAEHPSYAAAAALSDLLQEGFAAGRFDRVELVYNHYQSNASQPCARRVFLPLESGAAPSFNVSGKITSGSSREMLPQARNPEDYLVEPDTETLLSQLRPQVLRLGIYTTLLDSNAAEHAARTVAMQTATDNGEQLLSELTLEYNKGRQQKITNEILDIVGGSFA